MPDPKNKLHIAAVALKPKERLYMCLIQKGRKKVRIVILATPNVIYIYMFICVYVNIY